MVVFFRKKYRPPLPPDPEKKNPDHDRVRIFHGLDSESAIIEPMGLLTLDLMALMQRNMESPEYMTVDQSASVQLLYLLQNAILFFSSRGFKAATLLGILRCFCSAALSVLPFPYPCRLEWKPCLQVKGV
jgi:hypothetical protein